MQTLSPNPSPRLHRPQASLFQIFSQKRPWQAANRPSSLWETSPSQPNISRPTCHLERSQSGFVPSPQEIVDVPSLGNRPSGAMFSQLIAGEGFLHKIEAQRVFDP